MTIHREKHINTRILIFSVFNYFSEIISLVIKNGNYCKLFRLKGRYATRSGRGDMSCEPRPEESRKKMTQ